MRTFGRLRRQSEIAFVRRRGRALALPTLTAYASDGSTGMARIGVTVSKAVGGAVVRNRVRRRVRGALEALPPLDPGRRILFVASPAAAGSYAEVARDVSRAVARLARAPALGA